MCDYAHQSLNMDYPDKFVCESSTYLIYHKIGYQYKTIPLLFKEGLQYMFSLEHSLKYKAIESSNIFICNTQYS